MPQEDLSDYNSWKEFNWESSRSVADLKKYIRIYQKGKGPEERQLEILQHDLAIRKGYERTVEKVQERVKKMLEQTGTEALVPTGNQLLSEVVEQNIQTLATQILTHGQLKEEHEKQIQAQQAKIKELEAKLQNTLKSLHDLQSQNQALTKTNQTLTEKNEDQKQRILALEADKTELIKNLSEKKQKWAEHIEADQQQLSQEIQLIKEVLND